MPARALDDARRDRPARFQGLVVVQEVALAVEVADAGFGAVPLACGKAGGIGIGGELLHDPVAVAGQDGEDLDRAPVLGRGIAGLVEAPRSTPQIFKNVDYVDDHVNGDVAAGGLGADETELVLGPVDQDDPGPQVLRVAASASSHAAPITLPGSRRTDPASHLPRAFGPGRSSRSPFRPPGGAITSCGRRPAGPAS